METKTKRGTRTRSEQVLDSIRTVLFGAPLEARRKTLRKRAQSDVVPRPLWAKVALSIVAPVLAIWTIMAGFQIYSDPGQPANWTMMWFFGMPLLFVVGVMTRGIPLTAKAISKLALVYLLGVFTIAFIAYLAVQFNVILLVVAIMFGLPWLSGVNHFVQDVTLHREGYKVG